MPKKTKYFMAGILLLSLVAGWVVGALFPQVASILFDNKNKKDYHLADGTTISRDERMVILLLGEDARPGEKQTRTDTMIVAVIDKPNKVVSLLSVPRDTRVKIPGHGYQKINSANVYGGVEMAQKSVEDLLGIPIDYYVKTNFNGFRQIIDALGGVTIDVEKNIKGWGGSKFRITKGEHFVDGDTALQYARFRHDGMGDIGRTQRQQKVLLAVAKEALKAKNIIRLPKLIPAFRKAVETNMPLSDMLAMARIAKDINPQKIATQTLPGNFLNYKGVSYWFVDENQAKEVAMAMLKGEAGAPVINVALQKQIDAMKDSSKKKDLIPAAEAGDETTPDKTTKPSNDTQNPTDSNNNPTDNQNPPDNNNPDDSTNPPTGGTNTGGTNGGTNTGGTGTGGTNTGGSNTGSTNTGGTGTGGTNTGGTNTGGSTGGSNTGGTNTGGTGTGGGTGSGGTGSGGSTPTTGSQGVPQPPTNQESTETIPSTQVYGG